ncbi:MAG: putative motility protein [Firmicutes bacterium]|nr:putative motility protein [Bacillota bacterium]
MGIENSIAAASVSMSQAKVQTSVNIALMKKSMDQQEAMAVSLVQDMMESIPAPVGTGDFIDILA